MYLHYVNKITRHCLPTVLSMACTHTASSVCPTRVASLRASQHLSKLICIALWTSPLPQISEILLSVGLLRGENSLLMTNPCKEECWKSDSIDGHVSVQAQGWTLFWSWYRHGQRCHKSVQICQEREELHSWTEVNLRNHTHH